MPKDKLSIAVMVSACLIMLLINVFSWKISTIVLLLAAALVSMAAFVFRGSPTEMDGEQT